MKTLTSSNQTTLWDYVWIEYAAPANTTIVCAEVEFYSPVTYNNMTLVSVLYPASSVPSTARVAVQISDALVLTPGTDFAVDVTRDGGTTWTTVSLTVSMTLYGILRMYEGTVSLAGQPSGTSMAWRYRTLNNRSFNLSGVVLQQS